MPFLIVLGCLIVVNLWVTRRVLRADARFEHKGLHIAWIWLAPFIGALTTHGQVRPFEQQARAFDTLKDDSVEAPPQVLSAATGATLALASNMAEPNGFPVLDWRAVEDWLTSIQDPEERKRARLQSRRAWLAHMRNALAPHFAVHESDTAFVLSSLEAPVVAATANYVSGTRKKVSRLLGKMAQLPPDEKSILLVLDDEESYYQYVAIYYPDQGEFAFSGGMFINAGCPHFIVKRADLASIEPVIAHELTHSAVSHLRLPLWLDEGIAVNTEHKIAGAGPSLYTPHEMRSKHLRFWTDLEVQQFWSGDSFHRADDAQMLSYDLARIIVEQAAKSWGPFVDFVMSAERDDAGAASAERHLNVDLGAYVCALFEREPSAAWSPRRQAAPIGDAAPAHRTGATLNR